MADIDIDFGKSDKELAVVFGISEKEIKKIKAQIAEDIKKPSTLKSKPELTGNDAIKEFQNQISPSGMAKTKKQQEEALRKLELERSKKRRSK